MKKSVSKSILCLTLCLLMVLITACSSGPTTTSGEVLYQAGTYTASAMGNYGDVTVSVTFSDTAITQVEIDEHIETPTIAEPVFTSLSQKIVNDQTLAIDTISGATNTSNAVLAAVEDCVTQAGGDVEALKIKKVKQSSSETIEKTTDVVVVGGGGAGLAAAASAAENGASVILIEKATALGGNTLRSGGVYNSADPNRQAAVEMTPILLEQLKDILDEDEADYGEFAPILVILKEQINEYLASGDTTKLFDSPELHAIHTYTGGKRQALDGTEITGKVALVEVFAANALSAIEWLEGLGLEWTDNISTVLGALWPRTHSNTQPIGSGYINTLAEAAKDLGVEIMTDTKGIELIVENDRVIGIHAEKSDGTTVILKANNGVVMATGGYGANPEMRASYNTYWPEMPLSMPTTNTNDATGDGIIMGEGVDAGLEGMGFVQLMPSSHPETGALSGGVWGSAEAQVFVNKEGKRFVNEYSGRDVLASAALVQEDALFYIIGDQITSGDPQLGGTNIWGDSIDTLIETKSIYKADTLEDLALQLEMDPAVLVAEIEKYNDYIEKQDDPEFGKKSFGPKVGVAPFYATPRSPSVHHTMGGLSIDEHTRVLDKSGNIIPGFYAAGEVTGGLHAGNRLGGNAITDIIVFGRIAGASAAAKN
ncbi:flavocytochrome c [Alkaliphilus metalliredigens QYMF]|uniref:Urocanate reductase n=1 Tax=Alkaliphilus metalliredigens (strain QYMF) TaxID=293826 RepID=A6TNG7_ALKMQ|nr:flavocytochrome c [Alkaliphilus metalliredigens]ABR47735.1 flavocytochrome c [Alkaliphilus metalliredigens QYMF]